jgi:hypothetical protein
VPRTLIPLPLALTTFLLLTGCVHSAGHDFIAPGCADPELPVVPRGDIEPAAADLPAPGPDPAAASAYRQLTEPQCQCQAAANSTIANLLERERQAILEQTTSRRKHQEDRAALLKDAVLYFSGLEDRNRSAALALEVYFRLVEAEVRADLVEESLRQMEDTLARSRDLRSKGLKLPVDYETLLRQQADLRSNHAELRLGIEQLNSELARLLGMERLPGTWDYWPAGDFSVTTVTLDAEQAVAVGLAQRPQLVLLRLVSQELDAETLPVVRQMFQSINGLLGMAQRVPRCPALAKLVALLPCTEGEAVELAARRQQVEQFRRDREKAVANEIRLAVHTLRMRTQVAALARDQALSRQRDVREVEERSARGLASFADVTTAKLEWLRARGELIEEVRAWHVARIELKEAQGLLVQECGYGPLCETCP